jgi:hypothetical protein
MNALARLDSLIDKYSPEVAAAARPLLARLEERIPGSTILVYDNYNALAIGFAAEDRASAVVLSIALYPRWINLFFMRGIELDDPHGLLKGDGSRVRHVPKVTSDSLDDVRIDALIQQALDIANPRIDPKAPVTLVIKSVSPNQRPRRRLDKSTS